MKTPLITIYITNYNYARFLKLSIESVLNQSFQDFELLIIDDGSSDGSKEIIEAYRDNSKISIIYQQNKGLNITNNVAMRSANGKYLMRLDADDFLEPEAIEVMSNVLESDDTFGLVFPDYYYINEAGIRTGEEKRHNFEKEVSLFDQPAHGACTMIRLQFLKELGGYNESFTCQDGYDLWIKFISHHKVTNINRPLFSYRRHENNLTANEERILSTRKFIKEFYVNQNFQTPKTLAVIPVRSLFLEGVNWPLMEINGKSILQLKVETCLASERLSTVIISTSEQSILEHCESWIDNYENVFLVKRPEEYAELNQSLSATVQHAIECIHSKGIMLEAVMTVSLEFPYLNSDIISEAVNTLVLFKADAVLSVRPDNHMYYQHSGHTLTPILNQSKFTKLEREALYKGAGGIALSTLKNFQKNNQLISGSISHVVVDQKTAFGIFSKLDFEIYKALKNNHDIQYK